MSEDTRPGYGTDVQDRPEEEVREPDLYRVVLHNDDYTTMEFVVEVLVTVFRKDILSATRIMLDVHRKGRGLVGTYTYDIATTKADQVHRLARDREFPLRCTVEPT
jgi:ATP-dependent Clp protease adaptor protein ClpS